MIEQKLTASSCGATTVELTPVVGNAISCAWVEGIFAKKQPAVAIGTVESEAVGAVVAFARAAVHSSLSNVGATGRIAVHRSVVQLSASYNGNMERPRGN